MVLFVLANTCKQESQVEKDIAQIDAEVKMERFDLVFANAKPEELPRIKETFPFLFSKRVNDSVWIERMQDTLQQELASEVEKKFSNFDDVHDDIYRLFQHLKYYDNSFSEPRIVTLTSDVDYRNKVIVTDTIVLIALDTYLGSDHKFYDGIPKYVTQNMKPSQIVSDLATDYSEEYIFQSQRKTLLDEMIYFGKSLYFKDLVIPFKTDAEKIGYTQAQIDWAKNNESYIWTFFIEKEVLFSTDSSLPARFIAEAPFSKFYLELDGESPGRLGQYIGWQIVRAYMKNNEISPIEMLKKDADEIFRKSKFKPTK